MNSGDGTRPFAEGDAQTMRLARRLPDVVQAALAGEAVSHGIIAVNFTAGVYRIDAPAAGGTVWNNVDGHTGKGLPLRDATGHPTGARLTFKSACSYAAFGRPETLNRGIDQLYSGGLVGNDTMSEVRVAVSGIRYARYEVFVFASADTRDRSTLSITDGRTTYYYRSTGRVNAGARRLLRTRSRDPLSPTAGPAQYQVFEGCEELFAVVTGGSEHCVLSNNVFGLLFVAAERSSDAKPAAGAVREDK